MCMHLNMSLRMLLEQSYFKRQQQCPHNEKISWSVHTWPQQQVILSQLAWSWWNIDTSLTCQSTIFVETGDWMGWIWDRWKADTKRQRWQKWNNPYLLLSGNKDRFAHGKLALVLTKSTVWRQHKFKGQKNLSSRTWRGCCQTVDDFYSSLSRQRNYITPRLAPDH